jgi:hypothetical protein
LPARDFWGSSHRRALAGRYCGLFLLLSVIFTVLNTTERSQTVAARENFLKAILSTLKCPEFLRIAFIYAALLFTLGAFGVFQFFLVTFYVFARGCGERCFV